MVKEWHDKRAEEDLSALMVAMEMKAMEKKLTKYNVEQLGDIPTVREDGTMRVLVSRGLCKYGNKAVKINSNRMAHPQVQHKRLRIHGTQLQLVKSKFIGKPSIMVS